MFLENSFQLQTDLQTFISLRPEDKCTPIPEQIYNFFLAFDVHSALWSLSKSILHRNMTFEKLLSIKYTTQLFSSISSPGTPDGRLLFLKTKLTLQLSSAFRHPLLFQLWICFHFSGGKSWSVTVDLQKKYPKARIATNGYSYFHSANFLNWVRRSSK